MAKAPRKDQKREAEVLRRMLNTPSTPRKYVKRQSKPLKLAI
jgi:hypothetical protein